MQRRVKEVVAVGVSLSLTGKYETQGRDAFNGIRLWVKETNRQGGVCLVSVPSPASHDLRDLPAFLRSRYSQLNRISVLEAQKSSLAAAVVSGPESTAQAERFKLFRIPFVFPSGGGAGTVQEALPTHHEVIASVGTFQDDTQVVRSRKLFSPPVRALAA